MSVIVDRAEEVKAYLASAEDLFPVEPGGPVDPAIFERLHLANHRAYAISYERRDLTEEETQLILAYYAQAKPTADRYGPAELLKKLHRLEYHCWSNGGTYTVQGEDEEARRRLVVSTALEVMGVGGPFVKLADFGFMRRPTLETFEISSRDPNLGHLDGIYLIDGKPHPLEGFTTEHPVAAFQALWGLHDACQAHWTIEHRKALEAEARKRGIL
ncbi:hypothetical protein [Deinococcus aquaedulcis]|uniref:hypothetical protein n=1 Tax=Deinococcus aquaedulcis TaxID=2840455 RepID=UPI001C8373BD|nr:hypothetical protein [Deinococcus aquaedulcis]